MRLTENHIRYGIAHLLNQNPDTKCVIEVGEHRGERALTINCTQLGDVFTPQSNRSCFHAKGADAGPLRKAEHRRDRKLLWVLQSRPSHHRL